MKKRIMVMAICLYFTQAIESIGTVNLPEKLKDLKDMRLIAEKLGLVFAQKIDAEIAKTEAAIKASSGS